MRMVDVFGCELNFAKGFSTCKNMAVRYGHSSVCGTELVCTECVSRGFLSPRQASTQPTGGGHAV